MAINSPCAMLMTPIRPNYHGQADRHQQKDAEQADAVEKLHCGDVAFFNILVTSPNTGRGSVW